MKHVTLILLIALAVSTLVAGAPRKGDNSEDFNRLKQLVGSWKGTTPKGSVNLSYRLISDDNSLLEAINMGDKKENMITIYHLDNGKTMMTHYCSVGNQPRMRLSKDAKDPNRFIFTFVDATNLKSKNDPHMAKLIVTLKDADHFSQEWFMHAEGKETSSVFDLERVQ